MTTTTIYCIYCGAPAGHGPTHSADGYPIIRDYQMCNKCRDESSSYSDWTLKTKIKRAAEISKDTGLPIGIVRAKLGELDDIDQHNQYASETNAEYGWMGRAVIMYKDRSKLVNELYPPVATSAPTVTGEAWDGEITDEDLPF